MQRSAWILSSCIWKVIGRIRSMYKHAWNFFAARLAQVPSFDVKVNNFKARCCRND
jgi:hypothetical protein